MEFDWATNQPVINSELIHKKKLTNVKYLLFVYRQFLKSMFIVLGCQGRSHTADMRGWYGPGETEILVLEGFTADQRRISHTSSQTALKV